MRPTLIAIAALAATTAGASAEHRLDGSPAPSVASIEAFDRLALVETIRASALDATVRDALAAEIEVASPADPGFDALLEDARLALGL